jgi:hypothetical protein
LDEQLESLRRENERLALQFQTAQAAVPRMQDELQGCQGKLNTLENVSLSECLARLEGTREVMGEKERRAYTQGVLEVWESLTVAGAPSVKEGWFVDDHFYTFQVGLKGRPLFQLTVQTKTDQGAVTKGFTQLLDAVQVAAVFIPK